MDGFYLLKSPEWEELKKVIAFGIRDKKY